MGAQKVEIIGTIIPLTEEEGHLSRMVYEHTPDGQIISHPLSIVTLRGGIISITPFSSETHSTLYHDHPIHIYQTSPAPLLTEAP
ncbi:MAG: hypothetical protein NC217_03825 [Muribaculaceae bacterium]|nr:hypothetical protein [Muribaculaceae bacterium]